MIVVSLLLVLGSAVMLVMGLANGEQLLIWASIGASVVAALALAAAVLRRRGDAAEQQLTPAMQAHGGLTVGGGPTDTGRHHVGVGEPAGPDVESQEHPDPPDEPPVEEASASDALRIVDLLDEVLVVDGRPRYHVAGCRHLIGRATIGLPLSEAREAEFTPCAWCHPDSTLADRARRGS